jgi:hypothetical protein
MHPKFEGTPKEYFSVEDNLLPCERDCKLGIFHPINVSRRREGVPRSIVSHKRGRTWVFYIICWFFWDVDLILWFWKGWAWLDLGHRPWGWWSLAAECDLEVRGTTSLRAGWKRQLWVPTQSRGHYEGDKSPHKWSGRVRRTAWAEEPSDTPCQHKTHQNKTTVGLVKMVEPWIQPYLKLCLLTCSFIGPILWPPPGLPFS